MHTVMLIEDDDTMLSLIRTLLEIEGFRVVHTDQLQELDSALSAVRQEQPELVLLDVHLRSFNGIDLLRQIRQAEDLARLRVLMSSGMEVSHQCIQAGADDFILKPYMPDELLGKIRKIFDD